MRKFILFLTAGIITSLQLSAQVPYPTQPQKGYYENLKTIIMPVVPTDSVLINLKPVVIPDNFKDTLLKYDWYEIASYYFFEKSYKSVFLKDITDRENTQMLNQFHFTRYTANGTIYNMSLDRRKDGSIKVTTTTFDETNAVKLIEVKKVSAKNMILTSYYGETEMQEILSYNKGVMIMCVKQTPTATTKKFHIAYMGVPKTF